MAAFLSDEIYDQGLDFIAGVSTVRIDIHKSALPTTYANAVGANSLGNKTSLTAGATVDGPTDGRKVIIPAITDGSVTATDTALFWAATDATSVMYGSGDLTASQAVTSGNTFSLDAIEIRIRDATAV